LVRVGHHRTVTSVPDPAAGVPIRRMGLTQRPRDRTEALTYAANLWNKTLAILCHAAPNKRHRTAMRDMDSETTCRTVPGSPARGLRVSSPTESNWGVGHVPADVHGRDWGIPQSRALAMEIPVFRSGWDSCGATPAV
jgi:hypothetical protein